MCDTLSSCWHRGMSLWQRHMRDLTQRWWQCRQNLLQNKRNKRIEQSNSGHWEHTQVYQRFSWSTPQRVLKVLQSHMLALSEDCWEKTNEADSKICKWITPSQLLKGKCLCYKRSSAMWLPLEQEILLDRHYGSAAPSARIQPGFRRP